MALEAITAVEQAEKDAARRKTEAAQEARHLAAVAEAEGEKAVEDAKAAAAARLRELKAEAEIRIRSEKDRVGEEASDEIAMLRSRALERLDAAAEKIVERIVNG